MNIHEKIKELVTKERFYTYAILQKLNELDITRAYCELGYHSLFEYCKKELKYSDDQAYRRISSARLLRANPEIKEKVESGELTITHLSKAQSLFNNIDLEKVQKLEFLNRIASTSNHETEKLISEINPQKITPEKIKPIQKN